MSYYTELILGCSIRNDAPKHIKDRLQRLVKNEEVSLAEYEEMGISTIYNPLTKSSSYFGVSYSHAEVWRPTDDEGDDIEFVISARCSVGVGLYAKRFASWLRPYVEYGSGPNDFYAIITGEDTEPMFYYRDTIGEKEEDYL